MVIDTPDIVVEGAEAATVHDAGQIDPVAQLSNRLASRIVVR